MAGQRDIWALREGKRLVAVLEVVRAGARVSEALGPGNATLPLEDAQKVARLCARAGWKIGKGCRGLLAEFAGPILVGPHRMTIGKRVVIYAEWQHAVRIDMSGMPEEDGLLELVGRRRGFTVLTLTFNPARSCTDQILAGRDLREEVSRFGAKRLRRIVGEIALAHAAPTLVQHRLLALAA